jgi:hypothetical protein
MNTNYIETKGALLLIVVDKLKKKEIKYDWTNQETDNIGIIAQGLSGMTVDAFSDYLIMGRIDLLNALEAFPDIEYTPYELNFWEPFSRLSRFCSNNITTKRYKRPDIFDKLESYGFSDKDLDSLQNLNDPEILKNSKIRVTENYQNVLSNFIEYVNTWVNIMSKNTVTA